MAGQQGQTQAKNGPSRSMTIFLFFLAVVFFVVVGGVIVQNSSLGERSWQQPAVGASYNGYSGAPVGSSIYQSNP
ncbi:hypothetical protein SAMN02745225_01020 [Ferrithrix thermotolerans DSM 19514]|jgi:preprotein translocase subunit SecG|uniref:Uncharacterized protein n=1 Tax=Ferrithrix thermotolerans DSM 19514 TaxID=1121881 RepID=A0A1M4ULF5_9ACTN|nr:hypothetical protein [Ferrithrix thermotolerans]SHE57612.1 hypothetical protein SAMN02745225_01020 [Ferrithrix thermotolerans DSM 19514]